MIDRKQDVITTGGQNIYRVEIEEVLYTHPVVVQVAAIGIPDEVKRELAKAYIVLKKDAKTIDRDLIDYVKSKIAKFKVPRMVEFVDSLPQRPTGKILKREVKVKILKSD